MKLRRVSLSLVLMVAASSLAACSSKRNDASGPTTTTSPGTIVPLPGVGPASTISVVPALTTVPSTLPDSVVERTDNAYDYETVVPPTTVVLPTVVLGPLGTSPAERIALSPPSTVRIGSIDNDAAAAAPDTRIPVPVTLANPPTSGQPPSPPTITVPDLNLDATAAETVLARLSWPGGLVPLPGASPDVAGNAVANTYAGDPTVRRALRSASARLLQRGQESPVIATLVLVDLTGLGTNPAAAIRRSLAAGGSATNDLVDGKPALALRQDGGLTLIVISGSRIVGVAGTPAQETLLREVATILLRA